jgi:hypothetical protein
VPALPPAVPPASIAKHVTYIKYMLALVHTLTYCRVACPPECSWFLDRVATHILAFEGDSKAVWFEGGYSVSVGYQGLVAA